MKKKSEPINSSVFISVEYCRNKAEMTVSLFGIEKYCVAY